MTIVIPSLAKSFITSNTSLTISGSNADVGSSKSMTFGFIAKALAMATRCCCPPDNCSGYASALSDKPTFPNKSRAMLSASDFESPLIFCGAKVILSSTVI